MSASRSHHVRRKMATNYLEDNENETRKYYREEKCEPFSAKNLKKSSVPQKEMSIKEDKSAKKTSVPSQKERADIVTSSEKKSSKVEVRGYDRQESRVRDKDRSPRVSLKRKRNDKDDCERKVKETKPTSDNEASACYDSDACPESRRPKNRDDKSRSAKMKKMSLTRSECLKAVGRGESSEYEKCSTKSRRDKEEKKKEEIKVTQRNKNYDGRDYSSRSSSRCRSITRRDSRYAALTPTELRERERKDGRHEDRRLIAADPESMRFHRHSSRFDSDVDDRNNCRQTDYDSRNTVSSSTKGEKSDYRLHKKSAHYRGQITPESDDLVRSNKKSSGTQKRSKIREFCSYITREECNEAVNYSKSCRKLHFREIIKRHTDTTNGDCNYLRHCFNPSTCKHVHYDLEHSETDDPDFPRNSTDVDVLHPPQWIQCDLRCFNIGVLGKFSVVMADPPWDSHAGQTSGAVTDDDMKKLNVSVLQDDGYIFLWVTGRTMELGKECLSLWGYRYVDELIWVKTNQLQGFIRTGRTGHWLNHSKEHCLVGVKGSPKVNRGLDCDVIVSEVLGTGRKPDEIYGIIERLSPGTRKVELFGCPHNVRPNWTTLGDQMERTNIVESKVLESYWNFYK